jgi:hypothetical protein
LFFGSLPAIDLLASGSIEFVPGAAFVCWFLILLDAATIVLTVWSALTEEPRAITRRFPDPNDDLTEMY